MVPGISPKPIYYFASPLHARLVTHASTTVDVLTVWGRNYEYLLEQDPPLSEDGTPMFGEGKPVPKATVFCL